MTVCCSRSLTLDHIGVDYLSENQKIINFQNTPIPKVLDEWITLIIICVMQSSYVHTIDHTIYTAWQVHLWNNLTFSLKTSLWPTRSGLWLVFHLFSHDFSSHSRFSSHMGLLAILPPCQAFSYLKDFVLTVSSVWNMLSYTFSWLVPSLHWDLCSNDTSSKRSSQQKTTHHFLAPHSAFF